MSEQRNYAAEMAAYFMSAALQQFQVPGETRVEVLHALTDAVRRGSHGAFEALVRQLRPVLIRLARDLQPDDPQDVITSLFVSVKKHNDRTLRQIERRISQAGWVKRRTQTRHTNKLGELRLVHSQNAGAVKDNETGLFTTIVLPDDLPPWAVAKVFLQLTPEEQDLWEAVAEKVPFAEVGLELGCSETAARLRWFRLKRALEERLSDFKK
jgi:DNA-directed RNA polymerase specialized sigma24 family protein